MAASRPRPAEGRRPCVFTSLKKLNAFIRSCATNASMVWAPVFLLPFDAARKSSSGLRLLSVESVAVRGRFGFSEVGLALLSSGRYHLGTAGAVVWLLHRGSFKVFFALG